ncbi:pyridoxal 5'-phosphate synthase glutaminase subunit PdxT [Heyndrickxia oleronia]|uniref:pyridoxal 5'-phosphate synthase glutaminase subunit PdxT n=1 Tax=Heyndrickxia oleronia TaxID=38875 RepID=UPI00071745BC|nr:pyridoxal 5'-phosphate synthase glutaminase subunit PdxT [Heyndrickxia oleronia]MBU5215028.1 pyridoxal 5'-phosphate synthase glutaminase subunit PdxT [Heyndrickxia oleronia]MCM3457417.1 pyridoxal 5'-phosphate synthase glutaminase subunit PdxT [Heyndrickxia oleronia]NYV68883.1 pyridoxal 5'-phosphate synthase glutaminase subunit PdxT [Bacillus sp. Gen3]OJH19658.1 glutamine amidotransferase subunit PdxT [Bacillus obstructivus]
MVKIGVLGLQGAVREHVQAIEACGEEAIIIKTKDQLDEIDGIILPGGESTTMRRLLDRYDFMDKLRQFGEQGKPMFGTCAGLILLAKKIQGYDEPHIGLMDVMVERNSFGRQKDSFEADLAIAGVSDHFNAVFIRAPHIVNVGEDVEVLAKHEGKIVAARDRHYLGCSFHPELTQDSGLTQYFIDIVKKQKVLNK